MNAVDDTKLPAVDEVPMSYVRACIAFGNGDVGWGQHAIFMLARRLEEAREKHPIFAENAEEAVEVIGEEWAELSQAVDQESQDRQHDEALDVAATAIRFAIGEHKAP